MNKFYFILQDVLIDKTRSPYWLARVRFNNFKFRMPLDSLLIVQVLAKDPFIVINYELKCTQVVKSLLLVPVAINLWL